MNAKKLLLPILCLSSLVFPAASPAVTCEFAPPHVPLLRQNWHEWKRLL